MVRTLALAVIAAIGCGSRAAPAPTPRSATLTFDVRDLQGRLIPARITLVGVGGTPDPQLARGANGEMRGRTLVVANKVMTLDGTGVIEVPFGVYDIFASRGIEWTLATSPRVVVGPDGYAFHARLDHVIDTTGWLSGDFHVHAAPSWDSTVPLAERVLEFVGEGVDLIVSTDHNVVADYAPAIAELGAADELASLVGDEITTLAWGHFGVYPLPASMLHERFGARWRHRGEGRDIFTAVRRRLPDAIVQVNHPRGHKGMGYFNDSRFDRSTGSSRNPGFSLDFDALEILNGRSVSPAETVLRDWFAMLDRGHVVTAMGNSDTHVLRTTLGGYPRNYLRVVDDRPGKASQAEIAAALRGHHSFFTTGPFVDLRSGPAGIGDVVTARDGHVKLTIVVEAAPWIGVDSATLYVNGKPEKTWPIAATTLPQRLEVEHEVTVERDSYIVLRAEGSAPLWPIAGDTGRHRVLPLAITNPLFVDRDGDGKYRR